MSGQITVDLDALEGQEKELDNLVARLNARKLKVDISVSRGAIAGGPKQTAEFLNAFSVELLELVTRTRDVVRNIRLDFAQTDQSIADYFSSSED